MRLVHKLVLATLGPAALIGTVGIYAGSASEGSLREAIEANARTRVRSVMDETDRAMRLRIAEMETMVRAESVQEALRASNRTFAAYASPEEVIRRRDEAWKAGDLDQGSALLASLTTGPVAKHLRQVARTLGEAVGYEVFAEIFVTNRYGANVAQTGPTEDYAQADEDWWTRAFAEGRHVGDVSWDPSAGVYCVDICIRVDDPGGAKLGVLKAVLDVREVFGILDARADAGRERLVLLTRDGRIIRIAGADSTPLAEGSEWIQGVPHDEAAPAFTLDVERGGHERLRTYAVSQGATDYRGLGWVLVGERDAEDVFAPIATLRRRLLPLVGLATLLAAVAGVLFAVSLARRVRRVTDATVQLAGGQLDARVSVDGGDEVFELARNFNEMAAELQRADAELRRAKERAEAASEAKSAFLANVSHEIRAPLGGVLGVADLLANTRLGPRQRELVGLLGESSAALLRLIGDLLDLSKVEAGRIELEHVPFALRSVVGRTVHAFATQAGEKDLELLWRVAPDVPDDLLGDPTRLRQILMNLVGNAVKFTPRGEVSVEVVRHAVGERDVELAVAVRDTGIGIPEEARPAIFEAYAQARLSTTREHGGTGLGLAIASRLVALMGGHLTVESEVGKGSVFRFTARFDRAPPAPPGLVPISLEGTRVLLADDHPKSRAILTAMLERHALVVEAVGGGLEALRALRASVSEERSPAVVLARSRMIDLGGRELARRIASDATSPPPAVILLSSGRPPVGGDEREDGSEATTGVARYLLKPVVEEDLLEAIASVVAPDAASEARREVGSAVSRPLRILLAEDSPVSRRVVADLLRHQGHDVTAVASGRDAVERSARGGFDLAVMDVQMPGMDGIDATQAVRAAESATGRHLPIVALTAAATDADRAQCLAAGMDAYLAKPVAPSLLETTIQRLTRNAMKLGQTP